MTGEVPDPQLDDRLQAHDRHVPLPAVDQRVANLHGALPSGRQPRLLRPPQGQAHPLRNAPVTACEKARDDVCVPHGRICIWPANKDVSGVVEITRYTVVGGPNEDTPKLKLPSCNNLASPM